MIWPPNRTNDLVFGLADGFVKLGNTRNNKPYSLYQHPQQAYVVSLATSPDGNAIVSGVWPLGSPSLAFVSQLQLHALFVTVRNKHQARKYDGHCGTQASHNLSAAPSTHVTTAPTAACYVWTCSVAQHVLARCDRAGHVDGSIYEFNFGEVEGKVAGHAQLCVHSSAPFALAWGEALVAAGSDSRVRNTN
jgi:hypothetical protein